MYYVLASLNIHIFEDIRILTNHRQKCHAFEDYRYSTMAWVLQFPSNGSAFYPVVDSGIVGFIRAGGEPT